MPYAYVLYINDNVVGPCFELIRRVCEPGSRSKPHITIRYPIDILEGNDLERYRNLVVPSIEVVGPEAFYMSGITPKTPQTVFVKCASDLLETLSYKPDFPDSVFHITLYDGNSNAFAQKLLALLREFSWHFILPLPENTKLATIEIRKSRRSNKPKLALFPQYTEELFFAITQSQFNTETLLEMADEERLKVIRLTCEYIQVKTSQFLHSSRKANPKNPADAATHVLPENTPSGDDTALTDSSSGSARPDTLELSSIGLFLTPPELASDIVKYACKYLPLDMLEIDFGDPAIGTGVFFSALQHEVRDRTIKSAIGIEIDPDRVNATRERWSHLGLDVRVGDYLHMEKLPPRSLIVANPPYVRYQRIPSKYRDILRQRASVQMGMQISGQSSLYVYFLILSHKWMLPGAVGAWLIPSEFMATNYGLVLRKYLTENVELLRLHKFDMKKMQFENALVSSTVIVFRNQVPGVTHFVNISADGSLANPALSSRVPISDLKERGKWTIPFPAPLNHTGLTLRIKDIFKVNRGLATGANNYFIIDKERAENLGLPEAVLRPLLPKARYLSSDIIESGADGYPIVEQQLCLLDCNLAESEIEVLYPALFEYLRTVPASVKNATLVKKRRLWYQQEKRDPAPYLCTYMGRGSKHLAPLRFLWNKSVATATNTYLLMYPKPNILKMLGEDQSRFNILFQLLKDTESSNLLDEGRSYGGGLHKIEPGELLNLKLSNIPKWLLPVSNDFLDL